MYYFHIEKNVCAVAVGSSGFTIELFSSGQNGFKLSSLKVFDGTKKIYLDFFCRT